MKKAKQGEQDRIREGIERIERGLAFARSIFGDVDGSRPEAAFLCATVTDEFGGEETLADAHLRAARSLASEVVGSGSVSVDQVSTVGEALFDGGDNADGNLRQAASEARRIFGSDVPFPVIIDLFYEVYVEEAEGD